MKKAIVIFFGFSLLFGAWVSSAHVRGGTILTINGAKTLLYPVPPLSGGIFNVSEDFDIAAQTYLVGEKLQFEINTENNPLFQEEILPELNFVWDFGDGTPKETGKGKTKVMHTYTRMGTYIQTTHADYSSVNYTDVGLYPIQRTVIHVLPHKEYQLPKPVINIDDHEVTSTTTKLSLDLNNALTFDASDSASPSARIVSYEWNVSYGKNLPGKIVRHRYRLPQYSVTPALRVTDENGFFVDTYVSIINSGKNDPNNPEAEALWRRVFMILGALAAGVIVFGGSIFLYKNISKK